MAAEALGRSTWILRNLFTIEEQKICVEFLLGQYEDKRGPFDREIDSILRARGQARVLLAFEPERSSIPHQFIAVGDRILAALSSCVGSAADDVGPPPVLDFHRMNVVLYPEGASMGPHTDGEEGFVVILSLGCSVLFLVNEPAAPETLFEFRSGDALVFDSGCAASLRHGVLRVIPGTCPLPVLALGRISIQLRGRRVVE